MSVGAVVLVGTFAMSFVAGYAQEPSSAPQAAPCAIDGNILSEAGAPLRGARVIAQGSGVTQVVRTDAHGYYRLAVAAGSNTIRIEAAGYAVQAGFDVTVTQRGSACETHIASTILEPLREAAQKFCMVSGSVIDDSGPLKGARVVLVGAGRRKEVQTNARGFFALAAPEGSYSVSVTAMGYGTASLPVSLPSGDGTSCVEQRYFGIQKLASATAQPHTSAPPHAKLTAADINAFNDSLASQSPRCHPFVSVVNLISAVNRERPAGVIEWAMAANAAKVCMAEVHSEGDDAAALHLPQAVLTKACAFVQAHRAQAGPNYLAQTSWACGWASPLPGLRPIPGIMPPV